MKLLHTSDWHLGRTDGETILFEDQKYFIDRICEVVSDRKIDAVLIAGDVFDRALSSAEATRIYDYAMTKLCQECDVNVYSIAGNHDSAERLSSCSELLKKSGLYIRGELSGDVSPETLGDCQLFLLPWITEEKVRSVFPEERENINDLESAYRIVTGKMREQFLPGKRHIALSHAFVAGGETSLSDRAAEIGFATQIPAGVFEGFDYVALGHLHGERAITDTVRYSGTPMPYSFGKEETQRKGVVVIDTETMEQEFVDLPLLHKRTTIEDTLEEVLKGQYSDEVKEGFVRLRITDAYVGLQTLSDLKLIFRNLLDVQGVSFENEDSAVTMTMQELEEIENDPVEVFKYFCREAAKREPDEHLVELFRKAVQESEKEADL